MKKKLVGMYVSFDDTFNHLYKVTDENKHYVEYYDEYIGRVWERKEYISHVFYGFFAVYKYKL